MEEFLSKKKVLYIGYEYYNYNTHILDSLNKSGADVTSYLNVKNKWVYTILQKLSFYCFKKYSHNYGKKILKETKGKDFEYFFILHGFQFDDYFYKNLKIQNPNIKLINYTWDSIRTTNHNRSVLDILKHFDSAFSFDKNDCTTYRKQKYLPLFFIDDYSVKKKYIEKPKYDVVFIGSLVTLRRYNYLKDIAKIFNEKNITFYFYLKISPLFYFNCLLKGEILKNIKFKSLSAKNIINIYNKTNTIIDIPGQIQSGLTMRTIETLSYGLKLITTNEFIKNESFYNKGHIDIISYDNPNIDRDFILSKPHDNLLMNDYSIHSWLKKIFTE